MRVFISWSKRPSLAYALKLKALIEEVSAEAEVFVSETDISAGEDVQSKIIRKIEECDQLILCFTKENKKSPWLLFEAGYARGLHKIVIPLLFDLDSNWHSWIDNPMNIAREITLNSNSFTNDFIQGLKIRDNKANRLQIESFKKDILEYRENNGAVDACCEEFVDRLMSSEAFKLENPVFRNKAAHFLTGFETYDLFKEIINSFLYTGKYLWIYGRKNMKLFGGSFKEFFRYLDEKSYDHADMQGIDFRCLFLNPDSPEVDRAHIDKDIFKQELLATLHRANNIIGDNERLKQCFRLYSNKRESIIIRLDNTIIYSRPMFDAYGTPQLITDTPFEVFSAFSSKGQECILKFENVWEKAQKFNLPK